MIYSLCISTHIDLALNYTKMNPISNMQSELFHSLSYQLFPKKHIRIDDYNRIQSLLFDESHINAITDMTMYKSPTFYADEFNGHIRKNFPEYSEVFRNFYKRSTFNKKLCSEYKVEFEPGANWSARIQLNDSEKQFQIKFNDELLDAFRDLGIMYQPLRTKYTTITYDNDAYIYWGYTDLFHSKEMSPESIYVDIVPTLDDYSSVLKRLRSQIEITEKFQPGRKTYILLIEDFESKNISFEHVERIFESANIILIRLDELDQFLYKTD